MHASHGQRGKMSRRLWGKLREIGSEYNIELSDDPLGKRYDVNKFGIRAHLETEDQVQDVLNRLMALLVIEGWEVGVSENKSVSLRNPEFGPACAIIYARTVYQSDMRLDIGVF